MGLGDVACGRTHGLERIAAVIGRHDIREVSGQQPATGLVREHHMATAVPRRMHKGQVVHPKLFHVPLRALQDQRYVLRHLPFAHEQQQFKTLLVVVILQKTYPMILLAILQAFPGSHQHSGTKTIKQELAPGSRLHLEQVPRFISAGKATRAGAFCLMRFSMLF